VLSTQTDINILAEDEATATSNISLSSAHTKKTVWLKKKVGREEFRDHRG